MVTDLEALFPNLRGASYQITSPQDNNYNCIAWAAADTGHWWWPDTEPAHYWPPGVVPDETVDAFRAAFAWLGYTPCTLEALDPDYEKIALFADPFGGPRHTARQLPTGRWTSKLGELQDIEHDLRALEGDEYGTVVFLMQRPTRQQVP